MIFYLKKKFSRYKEKDWSVFKDLTIKSVLNQRNFTNLFNCNFIPKGGTIYMTITNLIELQLYCGSPSPWDLPNSIEDSTFVTGCMTSFGCNYPVVYRISTFSSNRHRKSQPFRGT